MGPARAGRRERVVIEARVASMVAHSGAVVARGVTVMMGAEIAALAAVNGGRLGGGGLPRASQESFKNLDRGGGGREAGLYLMSVRRGRIFEILKSRTMVSV